MKKEQSAQLRQSFAFVVLFLMGANFIQGGSFSAKQDSWLSTILSFLVLILWFCLLARISVLEPGKDVFTLLADLPGIVGKPLAFLLIFYCIDQAVLVLRAYAGFSRIISLQNTPLPVLLFFNFLILFLFLKQDERFLYRFSYVAFIVIVPCVVFLFSMLFSDFRPALLFPMLYKNMRNVTAGALNNLSYPLGNAFLLLGIYRFRDGKQARKLFTLSSVVALILSLLIILQCIFLLGGNLSQALNFPYDFTATLINVADFFSRIEVFASLIFYLSVIVRAVYFVRKSISGVASVFSVDASSLRLPMTFLLFGYSCVLFTNTDSIFDYLSIFKYFSFPIQYGIPLMLWIVAEVRHRKLKNGCSSILSSVPGNLPDQSSC